MDSKRRVSQFGKRFVSTFFRKFTEFIWQQIVVGLIISALILYRQVRTGLIAAGATHANWVALLEPYGLVLLVLFCWHFLKTPYLLHVEDALLHEANATLVAELPRELDLRLSNNQFVTAEDWRKLADKIEAACQFYSGSYQRSTKNVYNSWEIKGFTHNGICQAWIKNAGAMLLKSQAVSAQLAEDILNETDDVTRWLKYMDSKQCFQMDYPIPETLDNGTKHHILLGHTPDFRTDAVRLCIECSAIETHSN